MLTSVNMRQVPESTDLQAMKRQLSELDSLILINPEDVEILNRKHDLLCKIREMEKEPTQGQGA